MLNCLWNGPKICYILYCIYKILFSFSFFPSRFCEFYIFLTILFCVCCPVATLCTADQFQCRGGSCVSNSSRCNQVLDCEDASDEMNCCKFQTFTYMKMNNNILYYFGLSLTKINISKTFLKSCTSCSLIS